MAFLCRFILMALDPAVWEPHFWFTLHTMARLYPLTPNEVARKKYYDTVQNIPAFFPVEPLGQLFASLLDKYPVTPYLDSRDSFVKWVHFISNKVRTHQGKEEVAFPDFLAEYAQHYTPKEVVLEREVKWKRRVVLGGVVVGLGALIAFLYRK